MAVLRLYYGVEKVGGIIAMAKMTKMKNNLAIFCILAVFAIDFLSIFAMMAIMATNEFAISPLF